MSGKKNNAKSTIADVIIRLIQQREGRLLISGFSIGLVVGILVISYSYFWLQKPSFLIDPVINHAAEATIAARSTQAPMLTPTLHPTYPANTTITSGTCADYGISITSPGDGASVSEQVPVYGSYTVKPPEGSLLLMVKSPDSSDYWPSSTPVSIDETLQRWEGEVKILGTPPIKQEVLVIMVGKSGRALYEYYVKVGNKTNNWESINILTDDITVCDAITVEKK
jgi:hypothetical protein